MLGHINKEKMKILREQFTIKLQQLQNHFKAIKTSLEDC